MYGFRQNEKETDEDAEFFAKLEAIMEAMDRGAKKLQKLGKTRGRMTCPSCKAEGHTLVVWLVPGTRGQKFAPRARCPCGAMGMT